MAKESLVTLVIWLLAATFPACADISASPRDIVPATADETFQKVDPSVRPGDNFYLYASGGWIRRTEIPPDRGRIDVFSTLDDLSRKRTFDIIEEAAKSNARPGSNERKVADLYNAFMDEAAIEARAIRPLQPRLAEIAAIQNPHDLALALGKTLRNDVDMLNNGIFSTANLFGLWVAPGFSDSDHYMPHLLQGGLGMPSRDYYLEDSAHMKEVRSKYAAHVAAMLRLAGLHDSDTRADRIVALERAIADAHVSLAGSRRPRHG